MNELDKYLLEKFPQLMFESNWKISNTLMYKLGQCCSIVQSLKYLPLEPNFRKKLLEVSLIKGAKATTAIEGNTLSEDEIRAIAAGAKLPESRQYLGIEVKNVIDALNEIFKGVVKENQVPLISPELICAFHGLIGKDLGEHFEATPGKFRMNNVVVGHYRAPEYKYVRNLMQKLCDWLKNEYGFDRDVEQKFSHAVVEAIVTHVYIAWIHPFGDGNGRTARLLEFYILLRGGLPNICSHILSNHYNNTRANYYRQLDNAGKTRDITNFLEYAVQGLLDGLTDLLSEVQIHQLKISWRSYVFEVFDSLNKLKQPKKSRLRKLVLSMEILKKYDKDTLLELNIDIALAYKSLSSRTIDRDILDLIEIGLVEENEDNQYSVSTDQLLSKLPESRLV